MKKKTTLVLTSLLILTVILTTPNFVPSSTGEAIPGPGNVYHWKIMLAQQYAQARITGYLTLGGVKIQGTDFDIWCNSTAEDWNKLGRFVFVKIPTVGLADDIHYDIWIDWSNDDIWNPSFTDARSDDFTTPPLDEPHTYYQYEYWNDFAAVVVEVRNQPYDEDRPYFEWQIMMKSHGVPASFVGELTKDNEPLAGTHFSLLPSGADPDLQCQVVRTPYCTVPNDIIGDLAPFGGLIDEDITQFPWTKKVWIDYPLVYVDLEVTEVQMYPYTVLAGMTTSDGQLGTFDAWFKDGVAPVPFATRPPDMTPDLMGQNVTFTQRDPITGIVKLGVPWQSYGGIDHVYYSPRVSYFFRVRIFLEIQGCGWLYTGVGKDPILGSVDLKTWDDNTGCRTFGPDGVAGTGDDVLLAGQLDPTDPAYEAGGAGPPLGPCMQKLRGEDDIPGTADDAIGDGDTGGPDPAGSSLLYLPTTMQTTFWNGAEWVLLFTSPWPQLLTTGTSYDEVREGDSAIDGVAWSETGEPWEFFAGLDHPEYGLIPWKHKYCNAYVKYACVWSVMDINTALGDLDVHFIVVQRSFRTDCVVADVKGEDEEVLIFDVRRAAKAYGTFDEGFGVPDADALFDAAVDMKDPRGEVNIFDVRRVAKDYGKKLTPAGIV